MKKYLIACLICCAVMIVYSKESTVTKKLESFSVVRVIGLVGVVVEQGEKSEISITTKGMEPDIISAVSANDTLVVFLDNPDGPGDLIVKATIKSPHYKSLVLDGVGSITGKGVIASDSLHLRVNGTGKIELKVASRALFSRTAGAGKITLAGKSENHDIHISGAGRVKSSLLETEQSEILIEGAGLCNVHVEKELSVKIYGTGKVTYLGSPEVNKKIYGLGRVKQKTK